MNRKLIASSLIGLLALLSLGLTGVAQATTPQEEELPAVEVLFSSSLWRKVDNKVEGSYRIEQRRETDGDQEELSRFLVLGDAFSTKDGPDLKVVLSPTESGDVKGKTALRGSTILAPLKSSRGGSEYSIPDDLNLTQFKSVLIHCEKYTKLWAAASLEPGEVVARSSSWTKKSNKVSGSWEIARNGDRMELRLSSDYKTKKGPDLKFILSRHSVSSASGDNATDRALLLSPLAKPKGAQRFQIPAGTDLSEYSSLLLHCEQYSKLWAASEL